jgi:DNA-binding MarR family transcriptional regulator
MIPTKKAPKTALTISGKGAAARKARKPVLSGDLINPMDRFVGYKIRRLQLVIISELNEILRSFELRVMDFAVLSVVGANPGLYQNGITQLLGAEPPAVVLSLDRLEEGLYLNRRASRKDRRLRTLHLTPAGRKLLQKVTASVEQQEDRMKRAMGPAAPEVVEGLNQLMRAYGLQ